MKLTLTTLSALLFLSFGTIEAIQAQTFLDRAVINSQSVETLGKRKLDFRVSHRFGDMFGNSGGWSTLYGLENASDILIGFNYGLTDNFDIAINRTAGSGALRRLINTTAKWKFLDQFGQNPKAVTMAFVFVGSVSTSESSENPESIDNFETFAHRVAYTSQFLIARKWNEVLSTQLIAGYQHRNVVFENDENGIVFAGLAARARLSKGFALIFDGTFPFSSLRTAENNYFPALGFGVEFDTGGGHVFQINLTNATGLSENDFIPYTRSNWAEGEFRLGFTISRKFRI